MCLCVMVQKGIGQYMVWSCAATNSRHILCIICIIFWLAFCGGRWWVGLGGWVYWVGLNTELVLVVTRCVRAVGW